MWCTICFRRIQGSKESLERRGGLCSVCWSETPEGKLYYFRGQTKVMREKNQNYWRLCLDHYGKTCYCCGESNPMFLTIDHPNGDGAKHRMELAGLDPESTYGKQGKGMGVTGARFYRHLVINDFPTDYELRIACYNCNCGANRNGGVCPHSTV